VVGTAQSTGGNPAIGTLTPTSQADCTTVSATSKLLGGGATITQGSGAKGAVSFSQPNPQTNLGTPTGWQAQGIVTISSGGTVTVTAYAICSTP
jgi:hypothetical protein